MEKEKDTNLKDNNSQPDQQKFDFKTHFSENKVKEYHNDLKIGKTICFVDLFNRKRQ